MIRFRSDGGANDLGSFDNITISSPQLYGYYEINDTEYQYIFGSGEIHVSSGLSNDIQDLWNYLIVQDSNNFVSNHDFCFNNNTLIKVLTYETLINGDLISVQQNQTFPCEFGCFKYFNTAESQGYCAPDPFPRYLIYIIAIVIVLGLVGGIYLYNER